MFEKKSILSLHEIEENKTFHYQYKEVDFLLKNKSFSSKLLVFFHGAVADKTSIPVFRGYNYEFENTSILCIADKTLEIYSNVSCFWYIHPNYKNIYYDILEHCVSSRQEIIMTGSSAGCFPAIYYSTLFSSKCLVQNGQIYLERYYNFNSLLKKIPTTISIPNLEDIILTIGCPEIVYLQNKKDIHHYEFHCKPFQKFIEKNNWEHKVQFIFFEEEDDDKNPHFIHCPKNTCLYDLLKTFFVI